MAFCALMLSACSEGLLKGSEQARKVTAPVESRPVQRPEGNAPRPVAKPHNPAAASVADTDDVWVSLRTQFSLTASERPEVARELKWLRENPKYLARVANNAQPFIFHVTSELEKRDLPGELALLPVIESGYDPSVKSPYGAAGLWQFMSGTSNKLGLELNAWYDGRLDVVQSTDAALQYLQTLQQRFGGDWLLAVAAYNAGWGTIERAVAKQRRNNRKVDVWSLDISAETRSMVARLLALSEVVRNPGRYGVTLPEQASAAHFAAVELKRPTDLRQFAQQLNLPANDFRLLNAGWRRGHTGPAPNPRVLVPLSSLEAAQQLAATLPASPIPKLAPDAKPRPIVVATGPAYAVKRGDSLWTIARKHQLNVDKLAALNGLKANSKLKPGQRIVLTEGPAPKSKVGKAQRQVAAAPKRYKVRQGDSLWTISRQFKVSVDQLLTWNRLKRKQELQPGQEIVVSQPS
jgi:membrane-bound lytic murein transglycosylase D